MSATSYDLNRPLHLGRRDVFIERASAMFHQGLRDAAEPLRLQAIDMALYYLQAALEHSVLAAKASRAHPQEASFVLFIRTVLLYLHSARAILENERQLKDTQSALWEFLNRRGREEALAAFARGSDQLLEDVAHLFRMADEPFRELRQTLLAALDEAERARYTRAHETLAQHVAAANHQRHALTYVRTFSPTLTTKYG